ncbi:MAG TPA: hypothetical protein VMN03_02110 [Burkholderiales bacterium]|jgi:hypothetical protein|nr:hypothetical protein [Burkholderiales bacterium]
MTIPVKSRRRFMVGKYEVIAEPIPYAMHMLRYNVYLDKKRIGATVSMPSESDCRFLEKPPVVPPLKVFYLTSRPGRPKKSPAAPAVALERDQPGFRESLPTDVSLDGMGKTEDR